MIPLPPMPQIAGPPPAECEEDLKRMKWSIIAMIIFGAGRAFFAFVQNALSIDLFALLYLFITIVMGTFIFKDDEHLKPFYDCLSTTICSMCADGRQGGLQCLVPFVICTAINCTLDLIMRAKLFQFPPYGFFLALSLLAQAAAVFFGWRVFKTIRGLAEGGGYEMGGMGGSFQRPGQGAWAADGPPRQEFQDGRAEQTAGGGGNFVPFGGQGNRLGA